MCQVCGCGTGEARIEGQSLPEQQDSEQKMNLAHEHSTGHEQAAEGQHGHGPQLDTDTHDYGQGPAGAHAPGLTQARMVQIEQGILSKNDAYARTNRLEFARLGVLALNLVSSPGSGKTTLLTRTLQDLKAQIGLSVIEGDQQTSQDAERIRSTGVPAIQINTGRGCHLDAHQVGHAVEHLQPEPSSVLFIENVGNLVCPSSFDLGEAHKVAILSVTEGEDKPIKYPDMFHAADLMLLNKIDLLPHLHFDVERCIDFACRVNPDLRVLLVSATTGEGMADWYDWIETTRRARLIGLQPRTQTHMAP